MQKLRTKIKHANFPLLILLLAGLLLTACGSDETPTTTPTIAPTQLITTNPPNTPTLAPPTPTSTSQPDEWQMRWLKGIPCKPPCFENIIPGQTTAKKAVDILSKNPLFTDIRMGAPTIAPDSGTVSWNYGTNGTHGTASYQANSSTQVIRIVGAGFQKSFKFSELIAAYGQPTHMDVTAGTIVDQHGLTFTYGVLVIWIDQGFALGVGGFTKPNITNDLSLDGLRFFEPTLEKYAKTYPYPEANMLVPWQGFKDFDFYCRDPYSKSGEDCRKLLATKLTP